MKRLFLCAVAVVMAVTGATDAMVLSGTVKDSLTGTGLANVYVSLRSATATLVRDTTDATGAYSITYTTSGSYTLRATDLGTIYTQKNVPVTIDSVTDQTLNVMMVKPVSAVVTGIISDSAAGTPLGGVVVSVSPTTGMSTPKVDTTAADGVYQVTLPVGSYRISAAAAGYAAGRDSVTLADTATQTKNIALVRAKYAIVNGKVTDSVSGEALADAKVKIYRASGAMRTVVDSAVSIADGTFSIDSIVLGTYTVTATHASYTSKTDSLVLADTSTKIIAFLLKKTVYGRIAGTVTDSADTTLLTDATVVLYGGAGALRLPRDTALTGADGKFSFDSLPAGSYQLTSSRAAYAAKTDSIVISDTAAKIVTVAMVKRIYCTVTGTVTDSVTGKPLAGIPVVIKWNPTDGSKPVIDSTVTDSSGKYSLDSAFTGCYVRSSPTGYTRKAVDLTVTAATAQTIDLALITAGVFVVSGTSDHDGLLRAPLVTMQSDGRFSIAGEGVLSASLFDLHGRLLWQRGVNPGSTVSPLTIDRRVGAGRYIVRIDQQRRSTVQRIVVTR